MMTPLRCRMIDDMTLAGLASRSQDLYIRSVRWLAAYYRRSPEELSEAEVRAYLIGLRDRGAARGTFKTDHYGIRFAGAGCFRRFAGSYLATHGPAMPRSHRRPIADSITCCTDRKRLK